MAATASTIINWRTRFMDKAGRYSSPVQLFNQLNADYGRAVPDLLFTNAMSALSMNPSMFMSSRKFDPVTALPDCDFVCEMSAESTKRSLVVSPTKTPIGIDTFPLFVPSLTFVRVIAIFVAFGMPVQFTVTTLPLVLVVAGCPPHVAEATLEIG